MNKKTELEQELRLILQTALLGEIIPQIIFVTGSISGEWVKLRFHLDRPISETDRNDLDAVSTEVISHYKPPMKTETIFSFGSDFDRPDSHETLVYLRKRIGQYFDTQVFGSGPQKVN
ncbi:hypothetical protein [Microvirga splendida]|uniref:Uncharacterized protein n=1 Tax=Microvirga splendida TaxID=2795727 RepID=A0ABS0Y0K4_9HYPH|nr:hypothetical protein [Microvirga splendida]MBJ6125827.1 hypothetical protein [Microvirga splendida]